MKQIKCKCYLTGYLFINGRYPTLYGLTQKGRIVWYVHKFKAECIDIYSSCSHFMTGTIIYNTLVY